MAALGSDSELGRELERAVRGRSRRLRVVPLADNEGSRAYLVSLPDGPTQPAPRAQRAQARYGLTRRESEVLTELLRGASNKEIARRIGCATRTVEDHVARILRKLGASSRSAAIAKLWMERL
ncbi:MAG: LuxR family transcriptional regulator [Deltaproteobacteria bacterium]|nr:MAG: LuxR family transcriptional regulator [Deltaproteobacteria bacterium]